MNLKYMETIVTNKVTNKATKKVTEIIFIGIPGPTHHYGGLSVDNIACGISHGDISHPAQAALQAIALAGLLLKLGITVAIMPPQLRPHLPLLRKALDGDEAAVDDAQLIAQAVIKAPRLLEIASSSSAMWLANAATVTQPEDSSDGLLHITIANLYSNLHRRIEADEHYRIIKKIFANVPRVAVHKPLAGEDDLRDEGAANHMRLAPSHDSAGLNIFVYGTDDNPRDPQNARQTLAASQAIIASHKLFDNAAICLKQSPEAIENGVFHNDVIAVANENFLLVHEDSYSLGAADINHIAECYAERTGFAANLRIIKRNELTLEEAVASYFFNSQLLTLSDGGMALIAPQETKELHNEKSWRLLQSLVDDKANPITQLHSIDLKQSMKNGGGPACLRLRVPVDEEQLAALRLATKVVVDEEILQQMEKIIRKYYPQKLTASEINHDLYLLCATIIQEINNCLEL